VVLLYYHTQLFAGSYLPGHPKNKNKGNPKVPAHIL